jgi:hypothetical protein
MFILYVVESTVWNVSLCFKIHYGMFLLYVLLYVVESTVRLFLSGIYSQNVSQSKFINLLNVFEATRLTHFLHIIIISILLCYIIALL